MSDGRIDDAACHAAVLERVARIDLTDHRVELGALFVFRSKAEPGEHAGHKSRQFPGSRRVVSAVAITSVIVVFPQPLGPSKSTTSPSPASTSGTSKATSSKGPMFFSVSRVYRIPAPGCITASALPARSARCPPPPSSSPGGRGVVWRGGRELVEEGPEAGVAGRACGERLALAEVAGQPVVPRRRRSSWKKAPPIALDGAPGAVELALQRLLRAGGARPCPS